MREVSRFLRWLWPALVVPGATLFALGVGAWLSPPNKSVSSGAGLLLLTGLLWTAVCLGNLVALSACYLPAAWKRPTRARAYILGVLVLGAASAALMLAWLRFLPVGYI